MRPVRLALPLLVLAWAMSGCYRYIPAAHTEVAPGQGVRVRLSADEAARYQDLRQSDPRTVEGTLLERTAEGLVVEATVGSNDPSAGTRALTQNVSIPFSGIVGLDRRELDRTRTGLVVGGGLAVLTAVILESRSGSGSPEPGGGGNAESRSIPLFRFALPFR